jgi:transcriptional regulator with PAS, ATPase and Fis domain
VANDKDLPPFQEVMDVIDEPFVIIDSNYRIVAANQQYCEHYDVPLDQMIGQNCHKISHHSNVPCSQNGEACPLEQAIQSGQTTEVMHIHYDAEGKEELVELRAKPIRNQEGVVAYIGESVFPVVDKTTEESLLIGRSPACMRLVSLLQRVAQTPTIVLLEGESGVGKEKVAQYLHHYSKRSQAPFIVVDCGALGEMLETGKIRRLGGTRYFDVDVRIIAATHRGLKNMVQQGSFREDLYYRLAAFPIHVPTLRERKDDIPLLAEYFLEHMEEGENSLPLAPDVIQRLLTYDYPGNIRELRNIIERANILAGPDGMIAADHVVFDGLAPVSIQSQVYQTAVSNMDHHAVLRDNWVLVSAPCTVELAQLITNWKIISKSKKRAAIACHPLNFDINAEDRPTLILGLSVRTYYGLAVVRPRIAQSCIPPRYHLILCAG